MTSGKGIYMYNDACIWEVGVALLILPQFS